MNMAYGLMMMETPATKIAKPEDTLNGQVEMVDREAPKKTSTKKKTSNDQEDTTQREDPATSPKTPTPSKTPTPPPTKRRKMKTPTKSTKSPRVIGRKTSLTPGGSRGAQKAVKTSAKNIQPPRTPTTKTPAKTPSRNQKVTEMEEEGVRKFTIGRPMANETVTLGKVQRMKMGLEQKIRQSKRWEAVEDTRKRILTPAKAKRTRGEEGEWSSTPTVIPAQHSALDQPEVQTGRPPQPQAIQRRIQTPISSFLVPQTLEEREAALQISVKPRNNRKNIPKIKKAERSSSPDASPSLRKRVEQKTGAGTVKKGDEQILRKSRKMTTIFAIIQKQEDRSNTIISGPKQDNNNRPCARPGTQPVTSLGQERDIHPEESCFPTTAQASHHVTSRPGLGPMGEKIESREDFEGKSSHFEKETLPE